MKIGGDIAFINGVMKSLIAQGKENQAFLAQHVAGFEAVKAHLAALEWAEIEGSSGITRGAASSMLEKRSSSTVLALREKSEKLTPSAATVAPSG